MSLKAAVSGGDGGEGWDVGDVGVGEFEGGRGRGAVVVEVTEERAV
jgi:hypothetical protein